MYQLGWFSTARGRGSRDLLAAVHTSIVRGNIPAQIAFVFCSREPGESAETDVFLKQVAGYGIPLVCFSYQKFKALKGNPDEDGFPPWRQEYDREVMARLSAFSPALSVLAGYMLIVGPQMSQQYYLLNLHPAAPDGPKGTWREVIWQLIAESARSTGVMTHLATPELDRGPLVSYCTFSIKGEPFDRYWDKLACRDIADIKQTEGEQNPLFRLVRRYGAAREQPLIVSTVKAFAEGRVKIDNGRLVDACGQPLPGYDLTKEIDKAVQACLSAES